MKVSRLLLIERRINMPTTGYLREKKGRYYAVLNLYDSEGKRKQKSIATGLPVKIIKERLNKCLNSYVWSMTTKI